MIRFPRMHIAQSVQNRILNLGRQTRMQRIAPAEVPPMPLDVDAQSAGLNEALSTPATLVPAPAGTEGDMLASALDGSPMADVASAAAIEQEFPTG